MHPLLQNSQQKLVAFNMFQPDWKLSSSKWVNTPFQWFIFKFHVSLPGSISQVFETTSPAVLHLQTATCLEKLTEWNFHGNLRVPRISGTQNGGTEAYKAVLGVGFPLHKPYPYSLYRWGFLHFRYQRNVWWLRVPHQAQGNTALLRD